MLFLHKGTTYWFCRKQVTKTHYDLGCDAGWCAMLLYDSAYDIKETDSFKSATHHVPLCKNRATCQQYHPIEIKIAASRCLWYEL